MSDEDEVFFQRARVLAAGEAERQGLMDDARGLFGRKLKDVKADWERVSDQIQEMIAATASSKPAGFGLDEVQVSLAFNAQGKLVFVAEAGIEATVALTFRRGEIG